jgi:hypothetical protein
MRQSASKILGMCALRQTDTRKLSARTSDLPYCDHACYRRRNIATAPWSFEGLDNFAFIGLQLAGDFHRALVDMYRNWEKVGGRMSLASISSCN